MPTILLATDGSELAADAMGRAVELLGRDHRFVALTVVVPSSPALTFSPMGPGPDPVVSAELEERMSREQSQHLIEVLTRLGIEADAQIVVGDPGDVICDTAAEIGADLVVVGSHGHGRLKEILLGSVSRHVLHHAPCPVLAIRS